MYRGERVGVVIPAYNEAGFVGDVIDAVPAFVDRIYAVDDGSTDDTWAEIRRRAPANDDGTTAGRDTADENGSRGSGDGSHAESDGDAPESGPDPRVVPIRHDDNRGRGGCVKTGYRRALADGMDVVAVLDADGQMDPRELHRFVDPIVDGDAEYAKGNRLSNPELREEMSRWRLFGNVLLTGLTRVASGYWGMSDPQMGYTAASRRAIEAVDLDGLYDDFGFLNDMLVHLNAAGVRIVDVPVRAVYDDETSHIRYSQFVPELSWLLLRTFLWRLWVTYVVRGPHPVAALYASGTVALVASTVAFVWTLSGGAAGAPPVHPSGVLLAGGGSVVAGALLDWRRGAYLHGTAPPPEAAVAPGPPETAADGAGESGTDESGANEAAREGRSEPRELPGENR